MKIKQVLVAVDDSRYSMDAVKYSADYAKSVHCEIVLLHCHKPFPTVLGEPQFQTAVNKILAKANLLLKPYRKIYEESGITFRELLLEEPAGKVISETAAIEKSDLIIIGSKGKSDLEGLIVGSTTHKVLHTAPCPVLVVR